MAQNPFDQLAKQYLEEFLAPVGQVIRNLEVPGEAKFVDVFFSPQPDRQIPADLGLLGRMIRTKCSLEPFRNAPTRNEIRTCILKLIWLQEDERRKARKAGDRFTEDDLPQLWILASTIHQPTLTAFKAESKPDETAGIYFLGEGLKTAIVVLDQLPATQETLWLRILGRGDTQEAAIQEVLALPEGDLRRQSILRLLASWKVRIDLGEIRDFAEQEAIMAWSQAFLDWEERTKEEGRQEGIQVGRQEGRQEGIQVGRQTGQMVGQRSLIQLILNQKFGPLSEILRTALTHLSSEQLEALAIALLNFSTLNELETWLLPEVQSHLSQRLLDHVAEQFPAEPSPEAQTIPDLQAQLDTYALPQLNAFAAAMPEFKTWADVSQWQPPTP